MADVANARTSRNGSEPSTAELVQRATEQVSRLVRDELALARAELTQKGKHAGHRDRPLRRRRRAGVLRPGCAGRHRDPAARPGVARLGGGADRGGGALPGGRDPRPGGQEAGQPCRPAGAGRPTVRSVRADMDTVTAAVKDRGRA